MADIIISIIIISVIIIAVITLLIFNAVRNNKYKKYVLKNSESINALKLLNSRYKFADYFDSQKFEHIFDNKQWWYKTEPAAFLSKQIRDNLAIWITLENDIKNNRHKLESYKKEIEIINKCIDKQTCLNDKMNYKKCLKTETTIFRKNIQHPKTEINVVVILRYISKKGRVNITKDGTFHYVNIKRIIDSVSTKRVDRQTYDRLAKVERAVLSDGLRYEVMKRDGFKCVLCGTSAKDGAILHVDHIVPISKGGKTEFKNLRTLCEKCNLGKSNKIE